MSSSSFEERLKRPDVLLFTREPARTAEDSLRTDKVFGVTSVADLDRASRRRRAELAEEAKSKK